MPLTRDQAILGGLALLLAGPHHPMHVKTEAGVKFYHLPIGSLIIAHPHFKGDEMHDKKIIFVGGHPYAVPASAKIRVDKTVDVNNDAELAMAPKFVLMGKPGEGKIGHIDAFGDVTSQEMTVSSVGGLAPWTKELLPYDQKYPVSVGGKLAAWVPSEWKIYSATSGEVNAKWAKDPAGEWHLITSQDVAPKLVPPPETSPDNWVKSGELALEDKPWTDEGHLPPGPSAPAGPAEPKALIGPPGSTTGPQVTAAEIHSAIELLNNDKSTQVKLPLKKAGHPLAEMDYHGIAKAQIAAHPELKVPKGSKNAHVGQVKLAVLHHLAEQSELLASAKAKQEIAAQAKKDAEEKAAHAQKLASDTVEIGGVQVTKLQVHQAIEALDATKSTAIKQILLGKKNPLANCDYWAVVNAQKKANPGSPKMGAKAWFIDALKGEFIHLQEAEHGEGSSAQEQELHQLVMSSEPLALKSDSHLPTVARAMIESWKDNKTLYVVLPAGAKGWVISETEPPHPKIYDEITPEHKLISHAEDGTATERALHLRLVIMKKYVKQATPAKKAPEAAPEPDKPDGLLPPKPEVAKPSFPVTAYSHASGKAEVVGSVPAGSVVYYSVHHLNSTSDEDPHKLSLYWAKTPEGDWLKIDTDGVHPMEQPAVSFSTGETFDKLVTKGTIVPLPPAGLSPAVEKAIGSVKAFQAKHPATIAMGTLKNQQMHDTITKGQLKTYNSQTEEGVLAEALQKAAQGGETAWVWKTGKTWGISWSDGGHSIFGDHYYEVTPDHKIISHDGASDDQLSQGYVDVVVNKGISPPKDPSSLADMLLHDTITKGVLKDPSSHTEEGVLAKALQQAAQEGHEIGVSPNGSGTSWYTVWPAGSSQYKVSPDHKITVHKAGADDYPLVQGYIDQLVDKGFNPPVHAIDMAATPPDEAPIEWQQLHKLVADIAIPPALTDGMTTPKTTVAITRALQLAHKVQETVYVKKQESGAPWTLSFNPPDLGKPGVPGLDSYRVTPDHKVWSVSPQGAAHPMGTDHVLELVKLVQGKTELGAPSGHTVADLVNDLAPAGSGVGKPLADKLAHAMKKAKAEGSTLYVQPGVGGTNFYTVMPGYKVVSHVQGFEGSLTDPQIKALLLGKGLAETSPLKALVDAAAPEGSGSGKSLKGKLAQTMQAASNMDSTLYIHSHMGGWSNTGVEPPGNLWLKVSPGYKVEAHGFGTYDGELTEGQITAVLQGKDLTEAPQEQAPGVPVFVNGEQVYKAPAGSIVYKASGAVGEDAKYRYVKTPDGKWHMIKHSGVMAPAAPLDELVASDALIPDLASGTGVPVFINGELIHTAPPGSLVYKSVETADVASKYRYVKTPDGKWHIILVTKPGEMTPAKSDFTPTVGSGGLIPDTASGVAAGAPAQVLDSPPPEEFSPEALAKLIDSLAPAGQGSGKSLKAKLAHSVNYTNNNGNPVKVVVSTTSPDGWRQINITTPWPGTYFEVAPGEKVTRVLANGTRYDLTPEQLYDTLTSGQVPAGLQPAPPPAPLTQLEQLQADLKYSTIDMPEDKDLAWALARAAMQVSQKNYSAGAKMHIAPSESESSGWASHSYLPQGLGTGAYYVLNKDDLTLQYHAPGPAGQGLEDIPAQTLADAVGQHIIPNSVLLAGTNYKFGNYYKPKGKAYLEVLPPSPTSSYYIKARYIYHAANGSKKDVGTNYAVKVLDSATDYHAEPKGTAEAKANAPGFAQIVTPGIWYDIFSPEKVGQKLYISEDGSGKLHHPVEGVAAINSELVDTLVAGGQVLDDYGTTVLEAGIQPLQTHLFGSVGWSKADLEDLLATIEKGYGSSQDVYKAINEITPLGTPTADKAVAWLAEQPGTGTWQGQRDALLGLIRETIQVPQQAGALGTVVPVFLKAMPPGVKKPADIFSFNQVGYAHPFTGSLKVSAALSSPDLTDRIKKVSEQYGGGKVVGTHLSALSKDEKVKWLQYWKAGNMQAIFQLDAKGGKVSPAHPGAPANTSTHQVNWAPWGVTEIPASQAIQGDWTDLSITLPKAEIDNYIIKAGLLHAEMLTAGEKRTWVKAHREHDQDAVDDLSRQASNLHSAGAGPLTEEPKWTDDITPAKSYDTYLEEKTAAASWTQEAKKDFIASHAEELQPYAHAWNAENGYNPESYHWKENWSAGPQVIQQWMDDKTAKELAESLKPRYHYSDEPAPGLHATQKLVADQFGNKYVFRPEAKEPSSGQDLRFQQPGISKMAAAWGFRTPEARTVWIDGKRGVLQRYLPAVATMSEISVNTLTPRQAADVAREHVLDWLLDNASGHAGNFLDMPDGSVLGIDKDAAWKDFGAWEGLSLDGLADAQAQQLSSALYHAVITHQLSKETADFAASEAIRTSRRMSQMTDARLTELLETAMEHRATFPGQYDTKDKLIAAIVARKKGIAKDFRDLWEEVYDKAGWTMPAIAEEKLPYGLHSGFSEPAFFDHVMAAKSYGVPAFFAGDELEDGSFQTWTELTSDGGRLLRGESSVRGHALEAAVAWALSHEEKAPVNSVGQPVAPVQGGVKDEGQWYRTVIRAAKSVSRHAEDQQWEGPHTKGTLDALAALQPVLLAKLQEAQEASEAGPESEKWAAFEKDGSWPGAYESAASYYLGQIGKVLDYKDKHLTFKPGDLPQWKAPPKPEAQAKKAPEVEKQAVKVVKKKSVRELAHQSGDITKDTQLLGKDDHELHLSGKVFNYPGQAWHIELPTGEMIEFQDSAETDTSAGHVGRIRFRAVASDGAASLERIRAQLQDMGLEMKDATEPDMELLYWRHLANILADRIDSSSPNKNAKVWATLKAYFTAHKMEWNSADLHKNVSTLAHSSISPDDEAALWRKAWATLTSPEQVAGFAEKEGFLPHLGHYDITAPEVTGGKPFWYRFDADPAWVSKRQMPGHKGQHADQDAVHWVNTGASMSTEARLRALGAGVTGMSSSTDMTSHGSAGVVYTRLNQQGSDKHLLYTPRVLARTSNYAFSSDNYGDIAKRKHESYFDLPSSTAHTGGSNETLIKDAISLLDDVELVRASSVAQKDQLVALLKSHGIKEIRGLPVESRITAGPFTKEQIAQVRSAFAVRAPAWFDHGTPYTPPSAVPVSKEQSVVTTEAEKTAEAAIAAGPAGAYADSAFAAPSDVPGSPAEDVSQVIYKQATKPSDTLGAKAGEMKFLVAKRVSERMSSSPEDIAAMHSAAGLTATESWGATPEARTAAALVSSWAQGNSSPIAIALQDEAAELFGISKEQLPPLGYATQTQIEAAKKLEDEHGAVLRDFLKAQWELTQEDLGNGGVEDLTLYRIFRFPGEVPDWAKVASQGDAIDVPAQRPMASWAFTQSQAETAGAFTMHGHPVVVKTTVPRELVLSYPRTGFGCYNEGEFVVLDAPGKWEVIKNG